MGARTTAALSLASVCVLAFCIRSLVFHWTFVDDTVVFAPGDAMYHVRRALYTFENFPAVLFFESAPIMLTPNGIAVPGNGLVEVKSGRIVKAIYYGGVFNCAVLIAPERTSKPPRRFLPTTGIAENSPKTMIFPT